MLRAVDHSLAVFLLLAAASVTSAQTFSVGPDVIVGEITGPSNYASVGSIDAFSVGTTSCNIGDTNLSWIASTPAHPVIVQNLHRLRDGRFEQIGMAWLKHGFASLQGSACLTCTGTGNSAALGVGCSDPYGSSLNGSQNPLGARSEVNAATGVFIYPRQLVPPFSGSIARRLQAHHSDIDPALNPGARYFAEAQYVTADDAAAGNNNNNASYREVSFTASGGTFNMSFVGGTQRQKEAVQAWQDVDPSVGIFQIDIPNDGRMTLAMKATDLGGGLQRLVFALQNFNSDRSGASFGVQLPAGASVSNPGFHDVDYHSGEVFSGVDWGFTQAANGVLWSAPQSFGQNPSANALRWGSVYTFWFDTDATPEAMTIGLFKPGVPASVTIGPDWQGNQAGSSLDVDGATNTPFSGPIRVAKVEGQSGLLNLDSILSGHVWDLLLVPGPATPTAQITSTGQIVNVDLNNPGLSFLNQGFTTGFPAAGLQIPFVTPALNATLTLQMVVLDPTHPDGLRLSAANEVTTSSIPDVIVEASGPNSFINNMVGSGYWKVTHTGHTAASITQVVFNYSGAGGGLSSRMFDTDQTNMGGVFNQGTTYRNNSALTTGLDFSVSSPNPGSGWIGSNVIAGSPASFRTVSFHFVGGLFHNTTFAFDADTDNGPASQNGASQAGLRVVVQMSDGTISTGVLMPDPNNPDRAFVAF